MDQNQAVADKHLKKSGSPKCELHPTESPKYYCSDSKCRALLCLLCMKTHPKEHLPTLTTIGEIKSQTMETVKSETIKRLGKFVESIIKSNKMNDFFKDAFGNLMQLNTTMDLDAEDIADILADTLQKKYFETKLTMNEKIPENLSIQPSSAALVAFDHEFDDSLAEDSQEEHDENAGKICRRQSAIYCREEVESFYAKSKGQLFFWSSEDETLLWKDMISPKKEWKKYEGTPFEFLTILESEQLFFVIASENQLTVSTIEETSETLKICKEFPQEKEILFLASDHVNHLFVVTQGESGLAATIYELKNQNNELELLKLISFKPFDVPKKVLFDHINNLLFILGDGFLRIYKYPKELTTPLQAIFKIKATAFSWHQATQRLLLVGSGKLYQFSKGKFRLIRVIMNRSIRARELTNRGILCVKDNSELYLLSYKNPNNKKFFVFPPMNSLMDNLQEESSQCFDDVDDVDPRIGDPEIVCKTVKVALETPEFIAIYANVTYSQSASQKLRYHWQEYGGTIFTQRLIRYNFRQKKYQMNTEEDS